MWRAGNDAAVANSATAVAGAAAAASSAGVTESLLLPRSLAAADAAGGVAMAASSSAPVLGLYQVLLRVQHPLAHLDAPVHARSLLISKTVMNLVGGMHTFV